MSVIEMRAITKQFGDLVANDHVDFDLKRGEVHALLGENGAGKTTLMRILYGLYKADSGTIRVDDRQAAIYSPKDAIAYGIGMVTQHFALVPPLSVAENVVLGNTSGFVLKKSEIEQKVAAAAQRAAARRPPRHTPRPRPRPRRSTPRRCRRPIRRSAC